MYMVLIDVHVIVVLGFHNSSVLNLKYADKKCIINNDMGVVLELGHTI